jgi:predicted enzyme related to lactoylglutathione lyase
MAKITEHTPGMFSWADLATTHPDVAKKFYGSLFGWAFDDQPAGPGVVYSMARVDGESAAALFTQPDDEKHLGIPPHWTCYFTVKSADEKAKQIDALGGKVLVPPFDVFQFGRMCVLADPSGAMCALWEPKQHIGATIMGEHGTLGWADLHTRDVDRAGAFHTKLHGFTSDTMPMPAGSYTVFNVGDKPSCGMLAMPEQVPAQVPSYWVPYFNVSDCDATVEKAKAAGGRALSPPMDIAGVGRFATLADPQGAPFAVIRGEGG